MNLAREALAMKLGFAATILGTLLLTPGLASAQRLEDLRRDKSASDSLPIYPEARVAPEHGGRGQSRGTVSVENASVSQLEAARYVSNDPPEKVLNYYRNRMRNYGEVVQCNGGRNARVDIKLDDQALSNPSSCDANNFGENATELKVGDEVNQHIVAVRPRGKGAEFSLVHVRRR
jgi:hypothetical protein